MTINYYHLRSLVLTLEINNDNTLNVYLWKKKQTNYAEIDNSYLVFTNGQFLAIPII